MDLRQELALAAATALGLIGCASAERGSAAPASPPPAVEASDEGAVQREALAPPPQALPAAVPAVAAPEAEAPARDEQRVSCGASCGGSCGEPDEEDDE